MSTRRLVYEDDSRRRYEVTNDKGERMGWDDEAKLTPEQNNADSIRKELRQAHESNKAYVNKPVLTPPETTEQIKALTRQQNRLIRLALGQLDGTD